LPVESHGRFRLSGGIFDSSLMTASITGLPGLLARNGETMPGFPPGNSKTV